MTAVTGARALHLVMLVALCLCWGSAFSLIELALTALPPVLIVFARLVIGSLLMLAFLKWRGHALPRLWPRPDPLWLWLLALGAAGNTLPFLLVANGQISIDSNISAILTALIPLVTGTMAHALIPAERLTPLALVGLLVGVAGVIVLIGPGQILSGQFGLGEILVLGSVASYSLNNVIARLSPNVPSEVTATGSILCAAVLVAPFALPSIAAYSAATPLALAAVAGLALFPTALAAVLFMTLIRREGARFTALANYGLPLVGIGFGLALGETITLSALLAAALILTGIILASRRPRHDTAD